MKLWMAHIRNLEAFLRDYRTLLDVWSDGGVDGLVLGYLQFDQHEVMSHSRHRATFAQTGEQRAAFDPNPEIYRRLGVTPPAPPPSVDGDHDLRRRLRTALQEVVDRGWELWLFDPFVGGPAHEPSDPPTRLLDDRLRREQAARMLDTVEAFPMITGVIVDGPAFGYEIGDVDALTTPSRKVIFHELPASVEAGARRLGHDYAQLVEDNDRLHDRLHSLDPASVRLHATGGASGAAELLGGTGWERAISFRIDAVTDFTAYLAETLAEQAEGPVQLAVCPRTPAVAPLAGYDHARIARHADVVMPKLYYWHRGFDGLVGTWWRWVAALTAWNEDLSVRDACHVVRMLFGPAVPIVDDLADFDLVLSPEWLGNLVRQEATRAVAAVGDSARIVPWVDNGRAPHDGDPLTPAHLQATLDNAGAAGIRQVCYLNATNLTEASWTTLSRACGTTWDPRASSWRPDDRPTA